MGRDLEGDVLVSDLYETASISLGRSGSDILLLGFEKLHPSLYEKLSERYGLGPMIMGSSAERFQLIFTDLELAIEPVKEPTRAEVEVGQL